MATHKNCHLLCVSFGCVHLHNLFLAGHETEKVGSWDRLLISTFPGQTCILWDSWQPCCHSHAHFTSTISTSPPHRKAILAILNIFYKRENASCHAIMIQDNSVLVCQDSYSTKLKQGLFQLGFGLLGLFENALLSNNSYHSTSWDTPPSKTSERVFSARDELRLCACSRATSLETKAELANTEW